MSPGSRSVLLLYLLLASVYLLYLPDAEFVLDDWWMFQTFARAEAQGPQAEVRLAGALIDNSLGGTFRTYGLSFVAVFGIYQLAGARPAVYFLFGIFMHLVVAYLLYRVSLRLGFDHRTAFLGGALFLLLPTAHNPLFWFPSCAHYVLSGFWFLIYLHSAAGTLATERLTLGAALVQSTSVTMAMFSGDQVIGLLLVTPLGLVLWRRTRAALASATLVWITIAAAASIYLRFVNKAPVADAVSAKFHFELPRLQENLNRIWMDYRRLTGFGDGYYQVTAIGWGSLAAVATGLVVFWWLRRNQGEPAVAAPRALLFGAGLWFAAYLPMLFLGLRELRYDYLPSLGLAVMLASACVGLLGRKVASVAALLIACAAADTYADIQQCWRPQSRSLRAIKEQLRRLKDVRYHDFVAISGTRMQIGTAPHFAMFISYSSTPFVETVTGVWGVFAGKDIVYDSGRLGLEHTDFFRELREQDLRNSHVIACDETQDCVIRTLLAREVEPGRFELYPLKEYSGPPVVAGRAYAREEIRLLEASVYYCVYRP